MTEQEQKLFIDHMDKHLGETFTYTLHCEQEGFLTMEVLVYEPTKALPFWKLVTMGISDHEMAKEIESLPNRNEYMMFISSDVDIVHNQDELYWYYKMLVQTAMHPYLSSEYMSYGHTLELEGSEEEMVGSVILFPQVLDPEVLRCDLGEGKQCACLQVMPITKEEIELKKNIGVEKFVEIFYPEDDEETALFLAEKHRKKA